VLLNHFDETTSLRPRETYAGLSLSLFPSLCLSRAPSIIFSSSSSLLLPIQLWWSIRVPESGHRGLKVTSPQLLASPTAKLNTTRAFHQSGSIEPHSGCSIPQPLKTAHFKRHSAEFEYLCDIINGCLSAARGPPLCFITQSLRIHSCFPRGSLARTTKHPYCTYKVGRDPSRQHSTASLHTRHNAAGLTEDAVKLGVAWFSFRRNQFIHCFSFHHKSPTSSRASYPRTALHQLTSCLHFCIDSRRILQPSAALRLAIAHEPGCGHASLTWQI